MRYLLLLILSLVTAQPALAQGYAPWFQSQYRNCVPSIKPGPLSLGLGFLWTDIGGLQFDLAQDSYGNFTSSGAREVSRWGALLHTGLGGVAFENEPAVVTTDNGAGTGGFSIVVFGYFEPSSSTNGYLASFGNLSPNIQTISVFANQSAINTQGNGEFSVQVFDGTNNFGYFSPSGTLDFLIHVIIATVSNTGGWNLYIDGVPKTWTLGIGTGGSTYSSLIATKAGVGGYHDGSSASADAAIGLVAEYNRVLTPSDISALSLDPASQLLQCPR